jgi:class 3 adenylate cyclase
MEAYRRSVIDHENTFSHVPSMASSTMSNIPDIPTKPNVFRRIWTRIRSKKCCENVKEGAPEPLETVVLEKTIIKIGSLLALGFGEAGAEIIGQNMKGEKAAVNAMIPGRKVDAIFGFCSIRNFIDATEVLEDQIMVFVNRIAQVVHSCVHEFFGNPNQNVGDAFLIVWRLSDQWKEKQRRLADMAIISFTKIIARVARSPCLAEFRHHPKLSKRLPNYRVRLGFGLHSGWAIEGAIGSEFKIDASYLSANVVMASRLEGLTKSYGILIVISDSVMNLITAPIAAVCRQIDHVAWADSSKPLKLYTLDLDELCLDIDERMVEPRTKREKFRRKFDRQRRKMQRWSDDFNMFDLFRLDEDIIHMRARYTDEFMEKFREAYVSYEAGHWEAAASMLEDVRVIGMVEDGPSAALLHVMRSCDYQAPEDWPGYRFLSDT